MGMYDDFHIAPNNKVNIPAPYNYYQSKDLGCTLAKFTITEEGVITYTPPASLNEFGQASDASNEGVIAVLAGTFSDTELNIYADDANGKWRNFDLTVENNQIVKVMEYDKVLYVAPDRPDLVPEPETEQIPDDPLNPSEAQMAGSLDLGPINLGLSYSDRVPDNLELMYPHRMLKWCMFSLEARPGDGKMLLIIKDNQTLVEEEFDPTEENMSKFNLTHDQLKLIKHVNQINNVRGDTAFSEYPGVEIFNRPAAKIHAEGSMDKLENDVTVGKFLPEGGVYYQGGQNQFEFTEPFKNVSITWAEPGIGNIEHGVRQTLEPTKPMGGHGPVGTVLHPPKHDISKFLDADGRIDAMKLYRALHTVPLTEVLNNLKTEKLLDPDFCGAPLNPDGSLDLLALTSKAARFSESKAGLITGKIPTRSMVPNLGKTTVDILPSAFKSVKGIIFHRNPGYYRSGKKNRRYSKCIQVIHIGVRQNNYLSASAKMEFKLSPEELKDFFPKGE